MCGIAGYSGLKDAAQRRKLVDALGIGIDVRGGHAAGYVSLAGTVPRLAKRIGTWGKSSDRFRYAAGAGETLMMHSRYATCGQAGNVDHAHPFAIRRNGKSVLYGCHNGVLQGTYTSALTNKRDHTVDSRELFELLADGQHGAIRNLTGYGVITWMVPGSNVVHLVRLSEQSEVSCMHVEGGGIVWASTWTILKAACEYAGIKLDGEYKLPEIGQAYELHPDKVEKNELTGLKIASWWSSYGEDELDYGYAGTKSFPRAKKAAPLGVTHNPYAVGGRVWKDWSTDDDILADILLKADEDRWDDMTSAEWERWGRWSGKDAPDPLCDCKVWEICGVCRPGGLAFTEAEEAEEPIPATLPSSSQKPYPASDLHIAAAMADFTKHRQLTDTSALDEEWDRAYLSGPPTIKNLKKAGNQ